MRTNGGLRIGLLLLVTCSAPLASSAVEDYRTLPSLPPAPFPPVPNPPMAPVPPCSVSGFVVDCTAAGTWALGLPGWTAAYQTQALGWSDDAGDWAAADLGDWAADVPGSVVQDEFTFLGAGSTATITIDDAVLPDSNVLFVVKGGPAGDRWICKRTCTIPDTGFTVSVDPNDVPNNVWLGFESAFPLPNLPATAGRITVTFA